MVTWIYNNYDDLVKVAGEGEIKPRLSRYQKVRDLAGYGTMIPHV